MAGAPSQQSATQFGTRMKNSRTLPYAWGSMAQGANIEETKLLNSNLYPARFVPSDDFDTEWQIRQQIAEAGSDMISQKRPMPWTEKEIDYLKRKRDAEEYANYNDWLIHKFPLNDPANREILKRTVPRYFEERKAVLSEQINLSAKYANLRLFGPDNEDDLKLQYAVETGRVRLPQGPFHDPIAWLEAEANVDQFPANQDANERLMQYNEVRNAATYEKGLFNPFNILTWKNAPWGPNAKNMADVVGDQRVRALGPRGIYAPTNANYARQYGGAGLGELNRQIDWTQHENYRIANERNAQAARAGVGLIPAPTDIYAAQRNAMWSNPDRRFPAVPVVANPANNG